MQSLTEWSRARGVGIQWVAAGLANLTLGGTALAITATTAAHPLSTFWTILLAAGALEAVIGATVWLRWLLYDYNTLKLKVGGTT